MKQHNLFLLGYIPEKPGLCTFDPPFLRLLYIFWMPLRRVSQPAYRLGGFAFFVSARFDCDWPVSELNRPVPSSPEQAWNRSPVAIKNAGPRETIFGNFIWFPPIVESHKPLGASPIRPGLQSYLRF